MISLIYPALKNQAHNLALNLARYLADNLAQYLALKIDKKNHLHIKLCFAKLILGNYA